MDTGGADDMESRGELSLVYESPKDRLYRLAAEASCASGEHRPYKTVVWGRKVTKCLDCQTRMPDDVELSEPERDDVG
jgi:hypothetical protein